MCSEFLFVMQILQNKSIPIVAIFEFIHRSLIGVIQFIAVSFDPRY